MRTAACLNVLLFVGAPTCADNKNFSNDVDVYHQYVDLAEDNTDEDTMPVETSGEPQVFVIRDFGNGAISADADWATTENDSANVVNTTAFPIPADFRGARAHILFIGTTDPSTVSYKISILGRKTLKFAATGYADTVGWWFPLGQLNGGATISAQTNVNLPPLTGVGGAVGIAYAEQVDHVTAYDAIAIVISEVNGTPNGVHLAFVILERP